MANPFIGEIKIFSGNFAPDGWLYCNGQSVAISQFQALYAVIGNTYGVSSNSGFFILPNLGTLAPMGNGSGPGLTNRTLGKPVGISGVTLGYSNMPSHDHQVQSTNQPGTSADPTNRVWAKNVTINLYSTANNRPVQMAQGTLGVAGSAAPLPHDNMQPFLGISFIIAYQGEFPIRT